MDPLRQEVIELQIDSQWWLWCGYQPFSRVQDGFINAPELRWLRRRDPMDAPEFNEELAFPLLKPSIDIFGIPRRSRRQRGWYQVRSPLLRSRPAAILNDVGTAATSSDTGPPPDIRSSILESIRFSEAFYSTGLLVARHELGMCAQVCHHWAKVLQPQLFECLTISSAGEIRQLGDILRTSLTGLARHDPNFKFEDSLSVHPFTHLASISICKRERVTIRLNELSIRGPLPSSRGLSLRSVHGRLPRSLPARHFILLGELKLRDIHFRLFTDFIRLVSELPTLRTLVGIQLTWSQVLEPPLVPRAGASWRRHVGDNFCAVTLRDCTVGQHWPALLLIGRKSLSDEPGTLTRQIDESLSDVVGFGVRWRTSVGFRNIGKLRITSMSS